MNSKNVVSLHSRKKFTNMIYSLSYELKSAEKDYTSLFNYLEHNIGLGGIHVMRDTWWIASDTELNINDICNEIRKLIAEKDHFFFTKLSDTGINGWLPSSSWEFFSDNTKKKE